MAINLKPYSSIGSALIATMTVSEYRVNPSDTPRVEILKFTDYNRTLNVNAQDYIGLGSLIGISSTTSELRSSSGGITVTIAGIPNSSISQIVNSSIKGSPIVIQRVIFDPTTGDIISIPGNPVGRFYGIVNNYSLDEEYTFDSKIATNTITLICASKVEMMNNKVSGRRTNSREQKAFYPNDLSMDRVSALARSNFNFGAPQ